MEVDYNNAFTKTFGIEFVEAGSEGRVVATMPVSEVAKQPLGFLHGGVSVALAETVASVGAALMLDLNKEVCYGLEINANHIRSKREGIVMAIAEVLHRGRSTMVWNVRIVDEEERLISVSRCTIAIVPRK